MRSPPICYITERSPLTQQTRSPSNIYLMKKRSPPHPTNPIAPIIKLHEKAIAHRHSHSPHSAIAFNILFQKKAIAPSPDKPN
ncbi:MAG: hypothetical protein AB4042_08900 [Leptolyngbyaceae cyanobacterium]